MLPNAIDLVDGWREERGRAGRILVALDFDGTLAPIVPDPAEARLHQGAKEALERLAGREDTSLAIVSGRGLQDLEGKVGVPGLYYVGNHGLEIEGPDGVIVNPEAERARPRIAACAAGIVPLLAEVPGSILEDKGLTLSIHYRMVDDAHAIERIHQRLTEYCAVDPELRLFHGKKIFEVRPAVDWDKGHATLFLLERLEKDDDIPPPALFVGDDLTDEDAFRALRGRGAGVIVAETPPPDTYATSHLASIPEVIELLDRLAR